jgi:HAD superfamily hydrolase (TIGR01509 family)
MIKTIIFDLDGVLVDTKKIHFKALNIALDKINKDEISYDDHLKKFDGLPTLEKLKILIKEKKILKSEISKIEKTKNKITTNLLEKNISFNKNTYELFLNLSKKYNLVVASNAISKTVETCLKKLKIKRFIKFYLSNEDLQNPKPHPEVYLKIFVRLNNSPKECLIVEDSYYGREAAKDSGAHLVGINNINELNLSLINRSIKNIKINLKKPSKWKDDKLNVLIPMAGEGSRFQKAGYTFPKPLIEINKKPMIQFVIENLSLDANFIFLVRKDHEKKYNIKSLLNILAPNCKIVIVDKLTQGAASTTLLAEKYVDNKNPLIIANSDQYIKWNSSKSMYKFMSKKNDAAILSFKSIHPKWSYAKIDDYGSVVEVAEKKVISDNATVGVYFWKKGSDYVKYAKQMIKKNIRVNDEFYVCPVFNEAIKDKKRIVIEQVDEMWGLGTPEDLENFIKNRKDLL